MSCSHYLYRCASSFIIPSPVLLNGEQSWDVVVFTCCWLVLQGVDVCSGTGGEEKSRNIQSKGTAQASHGPSLPGQEFRGGYAVSVVGARSALFSSSSHVQRRSVYCANLAVDNRACGETTVRWRSAQFPNVPTQTEMRLLHILHHTTLQRVCVS